MKSLNDCIGQELRWVHPKMLSRAYELRGGDELLARLQWNGAFSNQVSVETLNGNWIIKQKGMKQTITVLSLDSQTELATVNRSMSGMATLLMFDGREYNWRCASFWRDAWTWFNNEDTPLLHLIRGARIQIEPTAQNLPDLALLATLGWYLHKKQEEETIAATIVPIIS